MYYKIIVVLTFTLLFIGCGKKQEPEKSASTVDSSLTDESKQKLIKIDEGIELKYNLNKGEKFKYRLNSFNKSSQSLFLKDSTISEVITQEMEYIMNVTVLERDDDGNVTLNLVCESVIAKAESNKGIKMEFDSKNPPKDTSLRKQFFNYEILVGSDFSIRISKIGEILDIYKTDKLINKILIDLPKQPSSTEKEMLRKNVQDGLLKPLVQQIFKITTTKNVNVDSSWTNTYPGQISVFDLENTARYQVKKFFNVDGNNIAEIHSSLTVKATGKSEASEGGVNFKFEKPKVNGIGKIYFDLTRHCIKKAESQVSFEINVQIQEAKAGGEKAKRVEKVESRNTTELLI